MAPVPPRSLLVALLAAALFASQLTAQPPTADESINRDRIARKRAIGRVSPGAPKWGFFGTIFHLILEYMAGLTLGKVLELAESVSDASVLAPSLLLVLTLTQVNDTKSAYNQISDLVNNQFTDDDTPKLEPNDASNNGTTETPKISRAEFLRILDRNLKGLRRLRDLEWREAWKDSKANIAGYKNEVFRGKEKTR